MSKTYIVVFLGTTLDMNTERTELINYLGSQKAIDYWEYCLPYSFFIKSHLSAQQISNLLENKFGHNRHFVARISKNDYGGRLPKDYWGIIQNQDD